MCIRDRYQRRVHGNWKITAWVLFVLLYILYFMSTLCARTFSYLISMSNCAHIYTYMDELFKKIPLIEFSIQCYHIEVEDDFNTSKPNSCLLYTSPSPRDLSTSRMPSSA
eukprot:TRINITY_DN24403_c0_g1_i1.p3 TRINITY_DN24403_c0_g1~~TRINITY_DN24403_c0_g1_i1.p3  ORF type:complete len:110 (-),score=17.24 TRINITY_DN24403_c0_g1_i1:22-351(-)